MLSTSASSYLFYYSNEFPVSNSSGLLMVLNCEKRFRLNPTAERDHSASVSTLSHWHHSNRRLFGQTSEWEARNRKTSVVLYICGVSTNVWGELSVISLLARGIGKKNQLQFENITLQTKSNEKILKISI